MEDNNEMMNESTELIPDELKQESNLEVTQEVAQEVCCNEEEKPACDRKKCHIAHLVFDLVLLVAVIALFILHFTGNKQSKVTNPVPMEQAGDGSVVYVNIDTINEKYEMVSLLTDSIDMEKQRQTVQFQNRQKALENKLANYQRNMQSGQLTPQQAQYAEASLQQESQQLQSDYAQAVESLEARYTAALEQIADSLRAATRRVNAGVNASYVFTYGSGSPMICADPTRDITNAVLDELNKPFTKKKK